MTSEQEERQTQALEAIASHLQVIVLHFQESTASRFDNGIRTLGLSGNELSTLQSGPVRPQTSKVLPGN